MNAPKQLQDIENGDGDNRKPTNGTASIKVDTQSETADSSSGGSRFRADPKHILFGRGKRVNWHPGNQRMRHIIDKYRTEYHESARGEKCLLVRKVYFELRLGGTKFLKRIEGQGHGWEEVSEKVAIEKVGHSLRCAKYRPAPRRQPRVCNSLGRGSNGQNARVSVSTSTLAANMADPSTLIGSSHLLRQGAAIGTRQMVGIAAPLTGGVMAPNPAENAAGVSSFLPSSSPLSSLDAYLAAELLERRRLGLMLSLIPQNSLPSGILNWPMATSQLLVAMDQEEQIRRSFLGNPPRLTPNQTAELLSRYSMQN